MKKISEDTNVTLDLKTQGIIIGFFVTLASIYFAIQAEISLAKELPKPEINKSAIEKIESDISTVKDDVNEIKESLAKMDERLYELLK
jgi:hypothetical protein